MTEKDIQTAIFDALRNEKHELKGKPGKPLSVRFSETTAREIEAEARLTRRTVSDVIKDRMAFGLMPENERDPHLRYRRRYLMPAIVEKPDDDLLEGVKFLRGLIAKALSQGNGNPPQPFLEEELRLYQTELELRAEARLHNEKIARARLVGLSDLLKPYRRPRGRGKRNT